MFTVLEDRKFNIKISEVSEEGSLPHRWCLLTVSSHRGWGDHAPLGFFHKGTHPILKGPTNHLKALSLGREQETNIEIRAAGKNEEVKQEN
jgi:hypothetical protein